MKRSQTSLGVRFFLTLKKGAYSENLLGGKYELTAEHLRMDQCFTRCCKGCHR
jgi:hypothetical protein